MEKQIDISKVLKIPPITVNFLFSRKLKKLAVIAVLKLTKEKGEES